MVIVNYINGFLQVVVVDARASRPIKAIQSRLSLSEIERMDVLLRTAVHNVNSVTAGYHSLGECRQLYHSGEILQDLPIVIIMKYLDSAYHLIIGGGMLSYLNFADLQCLSDSLLKLLADLTD